MPVLRSALRSEAVFAVVYPERQFVPPAVRAFVDAVVEWAPSALAQKIPGECRTAWTEQQRERATPRRAGKRRKTAKTPRAPTKK